MQAEPRVPFSDAQDGSDIAGLTCGVDGTASGSTDVCAGDQLKTRVALANYSTESMQVTTELYFSSDEKWQATDVASGDSHCRTGSRCSAPSRSAAS